MSQVKFSELPSELSALSTAWGLGAIARAWAGIAVGVAGVVLWPSVWTWGAEVLLVGVMQYHLSVLGHHTLHRNVVHSRALNDVLARYLVHGPLGLPQDAMRRNHMIHHKHFESEQDPELDHYDLSRYGRDTSRGIFRWWVTRFFGGEVFGALTRVVRGATGHGAGRAVGKGDQLRDWLPVLVVQSALFGGLWAVTGVFWAYFALWTLPQTTVLTGLMATRTMLEHADAGEPPERLMTFTTGLVERFLFAPYYFNFHAEHHLFPTVPAQHLGALHRFLRERDALHDVRLFPSYRLRFRALRQQLAEREARSAHPG